MKEIGPFTYFTISSLSHRVDESGWKTEFETLMSFNHKAVALKNKTLPAKCMVPVQSVENGTQTTYLSFVVCASKSLKQLITLPGLLRPGKAVSGVWPGLMLIGLNG